MKQYELIEDIYRSLARIESLIDTGAVHLRAESGQTAVTERKSFFSYMKSAALELSRSGNLRTSETYTAAMNSFRKFLKGRDIMVDEIDSSIITSYESWLKDRGVCPNSTSFYMRNLRAAYNKAAAGGLTPQRHPFRNVYTGVDRTHKRAIPLETVRALRDMDLSGNPAGEFARDMFMLSFYTRGMAFVDMAFLNNRITASLDWYLRDTEDLLSIVTIPPGSATSNEMSRNIGSMRNIGVEFAIEARPVVTRDFTWTIGYNVAWNKNEITELNNSDDPNAVVEVGGISGGTGNRVQVHKVGYPAYSYYMYEQVYDANGLPIEGEYVDQDGDGVITPNDRVVRYQKDPKVTMTMNNTFNWKNWDFGFVLRANFGAKVYNNVLSQRNVLNRTYQNNNLSNMVVNDFYFDGSTGADLYHSDYYLRNGNFLRCDNITLGYTWDNLLKNQLRLRLYAAVQNPFVITKYNGLDPEVFGGIDNNVYPRPTTYSIGLVATF